MMRAVVERIDARARLLEPPIDVAVGLANEVFSIETACDARLIGHDDHREARRD